MKPADFLDSIDDSQIVAAIQRAERRTSAQFRVYVSHHDVHDAVDAAEQHFTKLKMHKTRHRNAMLIFVAPISRKFAIYADHSIHQRNGAALLKRMARELGDHFRREGYTKGLVYVIEAMGEALSDDFPIDATLKNELNDAVVH